MQIKKPLLIAGAIATIGVASTAVGVQAATSNSTGQSSIADKIAQKFNLDRNEVQKVFEEDKATHEAERQTKLEEKLTQAVKDGKITEDQKTKIIAKIKELQADMEATHETMKDKTPQEHKALMEQKRTDIETWAKENNVPMEYLKVLHFKGGPGPDGSNSEFHMQIHDRRESGHSSSAEDS
ncbi:MAG TPA: hypothetical protein VK694_05795 [Verrucomicrobiae bacterium]|nr:hypothetical protein [Verrucomicrobiae bacterium]